MSTRHWNLPENWAVCKIGEIADIITGTTPSTKRFEFHNGDIPFVKPGDLDQVGPLLSSEDTVSEAGAAQGRLLPIGTVLISCIGNLGKVAILGCPAISNQQINSVIPPGEMPPQFLYFWAMTLRSWMEENASATTVTILNKSRFSEAPIKIPPLPEQRRIVAKIETLQERSRKARAALEAIPPLLEQFRQSVLAAAFRGDLTADWRAQHPDVEPASVLLDRIRAERRRRWEEAELAKMQAKGKMPKDEKWKERYKELEAVDETELPELPGGWCWARAEQICDLITKGTTPAKDKMFSQNGDIPFVKVYNLTDKGILDFTVNPTFVSEKTHSTELARSRILPGDVLMNIVGPPLGKVSIVPEIYPEWNMNQAMAVFRSLSGYDRSFLAFCLLTDQILSVAVLRAKATAGQFNLTLEICRDLPLPVAPTEEQKHIVSKLKLCLSTVESLEISVASKLELLDQLDQSILAKAFRGELVPQDPNDEPASVLLERIRTEREARSAKPRIKKKTLGSIKRTKKAPPVSVNENDDLPLFNSLQK